MSEIKVFDVQQTLDIFTALKDKVNSLKVIRKYEYINKKWDDVSVLNYGYGDGAKTLAYTASSPINVMGITFCLDNSFSETGATRTVTTDATQTIPDFIYNASDYQVEQTGNVRLPALGHFGVTQIELLASQQISTSLQSNTTGQYGGCYVIYVPIEKCIELEYLYSGSFNNTSSLSDSYTFENTCHCVAFFILRKYGPNGVLQSSDITANSESIDNMLYVAPNGYQPCFRIAEFDANPGDIINFSKITSDAYEASYFVMTTK